MRDNIKEILVSEEQIKERSKELGAEITRDYKEKGSTPVVVGLLRGSVPFLAELIKYIELDIIYDFMDVTSYVGTKSTGDIRILKDLETSVEDKDILIVEDIVDSGKTVAAVKELLKRRGAREVKVAALLDKPAGRKIDIEADYTGFVVGNYFVVGFGLDYNQHYRALPFVGVLNDDQY
ncbi:MAG: hypoxanthine phosphoribosyltransferase [Solobacterium sp.]|nr:hypoxanthine phosphoribosyltransferase [Solobacterium sp.]